MLPYAGIDTSRLLQESMKVCQFNHRIIANNVANVDTPRYNSVEVDFQATLRSALEGRGRIPLRKTRSQHFEAQRFRPEFENKTVFSKNDYNKVDIDEQMANLSKNTGRFMVYGSLLAKRFNIIKNTLNQLR